MPVFSLLKDSENYDSKDFTIFISKRNWVKNELRPLLELCSEDRDILGPDRYLKKKKALPGKIYSSILLASQGFGDEVLSFDIGIDQGLTRSDQKGIDDGNSEAKSSRD